ncbi:RNA binding protein [Novymonas esmeraldas]|uniref:RNA binding protein n=1 Tax=Novymonas esmeraldas TaxID=1808958 RepID=A0AAW0F5D9_9TRYP
MERTPSQSQSIYSGTNAGSPTNTPATATTAATAAYGNTATSYSASNSPNAVMYGGGSSSNGGAPSSPSVATMYASPAHAASAQPIRPQSQQTPSTPQQNMNQSQTSTSFNAYGGTAAGGSGSGFFYSPSSTQTAGAQSMYAANPSATVFPMRSGSAAMSPAQTASTQMLAPQTGAAAAAAAAWTSAAANINAGSKLFVGQVPAVCTEDQLRPLFAQFGSLLEIKIMREPNGRSKGSAWVRYDQEESAQRAITALNEKHIVPPQTNPLRVQFAAPSSNRMTQASQSQSLSTLGSIMPSSAQQQPQPNYAATYAAPQAYPGATTAYVQGQYATSPNLMAVRASPQQQQAAAQSASGKLDYLRSNQPGGVIYSTASPTTVGAMQQQQQQQQRQQPQSPPQQQQVVYAAGGQVRAGVMYASDAFAMTNQMATTPQQQQQQHHQWCS